MLLSQRSMFAARKPLLFFRRNNFRQSSQAEQRQTRRNWILIMENMLSETSFQEKSICRVSREEGNMKFKWIFLKELFCGSVIRRRCNNSSLYWSQTVEHWLSYYKEIGSGFRNFIFWLTIIKSTCRLFIDFPRVLVRYEIGLHFNASRISNLNVEQTLSTSFDSRRRERLTFSNCFRRSEIGWMC